MKLEFKNNFIGYFRFYYSVLKHRVVFYFFLSITVSFFDGIGLAMFMPLLQAVGGDGATATDQSMGELQFLPDALTNMGFDLTLNTILTTLVIIFFTKGAMKFVQSYYQTIMMQYFMKKVRHTLVNDLEHLSYDGFLKLDAGRIQNTLTTEAQRLIATMKFYFSASQIFVMMLTYVVLAFLANYQFAILVAVGAGLTNLFYRRIYLATKKLSISISSKNSDFNGLLIQAVHNFKYLKATDYLRNFNSKLKQVIDQTEFLNKRSGLYSAITVSIKEPMIMGIVVLVIYIQISVFGSSLTTIVLSLLLFYRALGSLVSVQNYWQSFIQNIGALYSVSTISGEMQASREPKQGSNFAGFHQGIRLKDVRFSYGETPVLKDISLDIPKNKTVALIGESGSGKTTLANVISCLVKPQSGEMIVDETPITAYNINSFRSKIGYISQEPVIFTDDIYNNITFWAERSAENIDRFWRVIELAALTDFVNELPDKEKTSLGNNGILVSGGQKQRISIARELYKDAQILILDEATSALDSETEKMIKENIDALHGSYTIVVIAHRLSTIKNVDTIYLLEKGRVAASGSFDQMIEHSPRFKKMVELQEF